MTGNDEVDVKGILELPEKYRLTLYFIAFGQFINIIITLSEAVHK